MVGHVIAWLLAAAQTALFIAAAPLLMGWTQRLRAHLQNRAAPPLTQAYRDLARLLGKERVIAPWVVT